ncbi:hypothetical protein PR048_013311 [Dryococelus australis]|uniref:Uncharacterized protein n=1 Tax=Dryococelus australis TaxID=614101 RepID=A0ABQ9HRZ5_9NEOP|nr:hypothetical protein PR048_013311 [Dryococelus australis]
MLTHVNEVFERFLFNQWVQDEGESFNHYLTALHQLVTNSNYNMFSRTGSTNAKGAVCARNISVLTVSPCMVLKDAQHTVRNVPNVAHKNLPNKSVQEVYQHSVDSFDESLYCDNLQVLLNVVDIRRTCKSGINSTDTDEKSINSLRLSRPKLS